MFALTRVRPPSPHTSAAPLLIGDRAGCSSPPCSPGKLRPAPTGPHPASLRADSPVAYHPIAMLNPLVQALRLRGAAVGQRAHGEAVGRPDPATQSGECDHCLAPASKPRAVPHLLPPPLPPPLPQAMAPAAAPPRGAAAFLGSTAALTASTRRCSARQAVRLAATASLTYKEAASGVEFPLVQRLWLGEEMRCVGAGCRWGGHMAQGRYMPAPGAHKQHNTSCRRPLCTT